MAEQPTGGIDPEVTDAQRAAADDDWCRHCGGSCEDEECRNEPD